MRTYCPKHDAFYNDEGWLESKCSDSDCSYCKDRPENHPTDCVCLEE